MSQGIIPSLFVKNKGDQTTKLALKLTTASSKVVVRFTGGCGYMSADDAEGLYQLFRKAFQGFSGACLFGGTRMLKRDNFDEIVPGITEVVPFIRKDNPNSVCLGVIPRTSQILLHETGMIIEDHPRDPYYTIVHPDQDICLVVQLNADDAEVWDAEYQECERIVSDLRQYAGFKSLLICYNGGTVTERELLTHARNGWPVLLIRDSGRITESYANNESFLVEHPCVSVADKDVGSIRSQLILSGILPPDKLRLVRVGEAS